MGNRFCGERHLISIFRRGYQPRIPIKALKITRTEVSSKLIPASTCSWQRIGLWLLETCRQISDERKNIWGHGKHDTMWDIWLEVPSGLNIAQHGTTGYACGLTNRLLGLLTVHYPITSDRNPAQRHPHQKRMCNGHLFSLEECVKISMTWCPDKKYHHLHLSDKVLTLHYSTVLLKCCTGWSPVSSSMLMQAHSTTCPYANTQPRVQWVLAKPWPMFLKL